GLLLHRRLQAPFAFEEDERAILGVVHETSADPASEAVDRLGVPLHPPGEPVRQELELRLNAVLVLEPMEEHIELEHPDRTDDGRWTGAGIAVEHLRGPLFR